MKYLTAQTGILLLGFGIVCAMTDSAASIRPGHWATPKTQKGVPNLHKVSNDLYRGAQPTAEGMESLKKLGVETIVNLRSFHSDRDEIGETGLAYEHIYMKAYRVEEKEAVRFLQIVSNPKRTPVFVHCMHGSDRTGAMCALYRIAVQGWSKKDAMQEMVEGGYGFHEIFKNLRPWLDKLDIKAIAKRAGIPYPVVHTSTALDTSTGQ